MARSENITITKKTPEYYSDFMVNFNKNPVTGVLARLTNEEAVGNAIKLLILTRLHERFYNPTLGSKVNAVLFDPLDNLTLDLVHSTITNCIRNHEKRATLIDVLVKESTDDNAFSVTIIFSLINIPSQYHKVNLLLKRVR